MSHPSRCLQPSSPIEAKLRAKMGTHRAKIGGDEDIIKSCMDRLPDHTLREVLSNLVGRQGIGQDARAHQLAALLIPEMATIGDFISTFEGLKADILTLWVDIIVNSKYMTEAGVIDVKKFKEAASLVVAYRQGIHHMAGSAGAAPEVAEASPQQQQCIIT